MSELDPRRTSDQNRLLWPLLGDWAKQVSWPHQEKGVWTVGPMSSMSWKAVLSAAFEGQMDMAQGLSGGTVMVGASTSNYGVRKFSDFITFIYAEGTDRGVKFSDKSTQIRQTYGASHDQSA